MSQWVTTGSALIKGVERMNAVIVRPQQQGTVFPPRNSYTMDVDRRMNRNCYAYGGFGHIAKNYRNRRVEMNKRMEIEQDNNNLNRDGGLVSPN